MRVGRRRRRGAAGRGGRRPAVQRLQNSAPTTPPRERAAALLLYSPTDFSRVRSPSHRDHGPMAAGPARIAAMREVSLRLAGRAAAGVVPGGVGQTGGGELQPGGGGKVEMKGVPITPHHRLRKATSDFGANPVTTTSNAG